MQDCEFAASTGLQSLQHFVELHLSQFLNPVFVVPQLIAEKRQFLKILVQFIPLLKQGPAYDFIQIQIPSLEGLIDPRDPVHLIIMRPVDNAALAACLLADLAEKSIGFFVVRTETM